MTDWIDAHVHVLGGDEGALSELAAREAQFGYTHANFLSVEGMDDAAQNALAIGFKLLSERHYAFGGLHYRFSYDFADEALRLWELGLDGIKMIENKPTERLRLRFAQDDARYERMYGAAEEAGIPFLLHVNDPRSFWEEDKIPDWARAAGYFYGDGRYPSYETILSESLSLLEKHPKLRVCFAHFLFLSDDFDRLCRIMDRYPNVYLDVTAGTEMYYDFSSRHAAWRRFFCDYRDRILYGTDTCAPIEGEDVRITEELNRLERAFFCGGEAIPLWGETVYGLDLPEEVFADLTVNNFRRFAGERPRSIDRARAAQYLDGRLSDPSFGLTERERKIVGKIMGDCLQKSDSDSII